ncbi:MAG: hypothetical protein EA392_04355 [Cryomorphaceae bacterium]|nr:MAG: hypothetical protein EA392_04355 [Cryomorphaceae bacterium]
MYRHLIFCMVLLLLAAPQAFAQKKNKKKKDSGTPEAVEPTREPTNTLVEFPYDDVDWLNSPQRIRRAALNGKFVLLSFWAMSSELCLTQLDWMNQLKKEHRSLETIIVHSPKYPAERDTSFLRDAIIKHNIQFPVLNDQNFFLWDEYMIEAWPTHLLFNPEGELVMRWQGAKPGADFSDFISRYEGRVVSTGSFYSSELGKFQQGLMAFPTFIENDGVIFLFVSDTRGNRIHKVDVNGIVEETIGIGKEGWTDGSYMSAKFKGPRGMAYHKSDSALYIADTGNNLIRRYDLRKQMVSTVLGNGLRSFEIPDTIIGSSHGLNQPTDITIVDDLLYITMTGWNQIWKYNLITGIAEPHAGTGKFGFEDGKLEASLLAEPYGITHDNDGVIYFTERQSSAVRSLTRNRVVTITGKGVFEYGDVDGKSKEALLQAPAGITYHAKKLYVADQFNNKIKEIDPGSGRVETLIGTGDRGYRNGSGLRAILNKPTGLTFLRDKMYFSDTYNHNLRVFNPERDFVRPFEFENKFEMSFQAVNNTQLLELDTIYVPRGESGITLQFELGGNWYIEENAPNEVIITQRNIGVQPDDDGFNRELGQIRLEIENYGALTHFFADVSLFYRPVDNEQLIFHRTFTVMVHVRMDEEAPPEQNVLFIVPPLRTAHHSAETDRG